MYHNLFDQSFFTRLARFTLSPRLRPASGLAGRYKTGKKGSGVEFSDIREYLAGDDIRRIDWNAYARLDKLFVKLYMDEREASYHVLIDTSRSMAIPDAKAAHTLHSAAAIAYMALNSGDRVDISFLNDQKNQTSKSCVGKPSFYHLADKLAQITFNGGCDLASSIAALPLHGRGTTFIISDFFSLISPESLRSRNGSVFFSEESSSEKRSLSKLLKQLSEKRQSVVLVHTLSRQEEEPERLFSDETGDRVFSLTDSENSEQLRVSPSPELFRRYRKNKTAFEHMLSDTAAHCGALYLKTISDEPVEKFLQDGIKSGLWR